MEKIVSEKPYVYEGDKPFIFVSYSHKDAQYVYKDLWKLNEYGINFWYDDGLNAGDEWDKKVEEHIKKDNCKLVISYLSENSISSAVCKEIKLIKQYDKNNFTIKIGEKSEKEIILAGITKDMKLMDYTNVFLDYFSIDKIYISRDEDINKDYHINDVIKNIKNYGFNIDIEIVKKENKKKKVYLLYKDSAFSNSIVEGIKEYFKNIDEIEIFEHIVKKNKTDEEALIEMNASIQDDLEKYDAFMIRTAKKFNSVMIDNIKKLLYNNKKVILLDIGLNDEQKQKFDILPSYVGSNFEVGGTLLAERIIELTKKIEYDNTKLLLLSGPNKNEPAKTRFVALENRLNDNFNESYLTYPIDDFEDKGVDEIEEFSKKWVGEYSIENKTVILYCANDKLASKVMRIMSGADTERLLYKNLSKAKKIIFVGYDGIRDKADELDLRKYNFDYLTIDVVPKKQGEDAAKKIYELLYKNVDNQSILTIPELIENVKLPIEKNNNADDLKELLDNKKMFIIDLDGTIANTELFHWKAYNELLKKMNVKLKYDDINRYIGNAETDIYKMIKNDYNIDFDEDKFLENRIIKYLELVKEKELKPFDFIYDILKKYDGKVEYYMVTSQVPDVVNWLISYWKLDKFFNMEKNVCCCHNGKSKKDVYLNIKDKIINEKNGNSNDIVLFEDSNKYLQIGKQLGFTTIAIEHEYNQNTLKNCDAILSEKAINGLFVGICGIDIIYYGDKNIPLENEKIKLLEYSVEVGGPATNAAITYAKLGGEATLISSIGNTKTGQLLKSILKENNVNVIDIAEDRNQNCNVSSIYVNKETGSRTIFSGQNGKINKIKNTKSLDKIIRKMKFVLYDGNLNGVEKELVDAIQRNNKELILDLGSHKDGFKICFEASPIAISSETYKNNEGLDIFGLSKKYEFRNVAKTRGEKSIQYIENGEIKEIEIKKVKAIDTLGAGDIFHGAFCYFRYIKKMDFSQALKEAGIFAGRTVEKKGVNGGLIYAIEEMLE